MHAESRHCQIASLLTRCLLLFCAVDTGVCGRQTGASRHTAVPSHSGPASRHLAWHQQPEAAGPSCVRAPSSEQRPSSGAPSGTPSGIGSSITGALHQAHWLFHRNQKYRIWLAARQIVPLQYGPELAQAWHRIAPSSKARLGRSATPAAPPGTSSSSNRKLLDKQCAAMPQTSQQCHISDTVIYSRRAV